MKIIGFLLAVTNFLFFSFISNAQITVYDNNPTVTVPKEDKAFSEIEKLAKQRDLEGPEISKVNIKDGYIVRVKSKLIIRTSITDNVAVKGAKVYIYKGSNPKKDFHLNGVKLKPSGQPNEYYAKLKAPSVAGPGRIFIVAEDLSSNRTIKEIKIQIER